MIKEAIEKIEAMAATTVKEIDGHSYIIDKDGVYIEIRPELDVPDVLVVRSLDALVKMVRTEAMRRYDKPLYISVPTPLQVECFAQPCEDLRENRLTYYIAKATDVPGWEKEAMMQFEEAMIALRTRFQHTNDTDYALRLLSEITTGAKMTLNDNGIATTVVTQKGVALQGNEAIRPIVTLKPYRTFQEVDQPASEFLIRVSERGIKFIEADGGMWRLVARQTIKIFLEDALKDEVDSGAVVIAL